MTVLGFLPSNRMICFYDLACFTGRQDHSWPAVATVASWLSLAGGNAFPSLRQKIIWSFGKH